MSDLNQQANALDDIDTYTGRTIDDTAYVLACLMAGDGGPELQRMAAAELSMEHDHAPHH